jgi:hypothetical protein
VTEQPGTYSWTQPICDDCWDAEHPDRLSPRGDVGEREICVRCGFGTNSGIYIRTDPEKAGYPSILR